MKNLNSNKKEQKENKENIQIEHFPLNERLHTDVLEEKYGDIHAEVISHDDFLREAHLVDKDGISRTYAITLLSQFEDDEVSKINHEIKSGAAIGKTFRKYGYSIRKNVIDVSIFKIPEWLKKKFAIESDYAKVRLSEFYAKKQNKEPILYGIVAEVYSPDFRLPIINQFDESQKSALSSVFHEIGIKKEEIWRRIGADNDYHDIWNLFQEAKQKSLEEVEKIRERIKKIMYAKRN